MKLFRTLRWATPFLLFAAPSFALAASLPAPHPFQDEESGDEEGEDEEETDENTAKWFAIVNADVHTGTGAVLRGASILAKDGVIKQIGYDFFMPEATEILDARGMRVYPGLVALGATSRIASGLYSDLQPEELDANTDTHYGIDERETDWHDRNSHVDPDQHLESPDEVDDRGHVEDPEGDYVEANGAPLAAGERNKIEDGFDPFSQYLVLALATGITTAEQSGAALKLRRGEIDDVLMNERNLANFTWTTRAPMAIGQTREKFAIAAKYRRALAAWNELSDKDKKEQKEPKKPKGFDPSAFAVLEGDLLAAFNADERQDLLGIARFAQDYGFRPVIFGCREGWTVADELGRAGAYAVITPRDRVPKHESLLREGGSSIENAALLHDAGVQVAIRPSNTSFDLGGITGRDLLHLPVEAAFGVRGGLPEDAALAAISSVPARILGVDHRVGTLEVGKDLDAIVMSGDVLHYETFVEWAVVGGKLVYDKQDEVFFAHIRPRPEPVEPEAASDDDAGDDGDDGDDAKADESGDDDSDDDSDES